MNTISKSYRPHLDWLNRFAGALLLLTVSVQMLPAQTENSTEKIRVTPSPVSQKIGSAISWQPDFDTAIAKSKLAGKPVFWYVPTLPNTFMDRKIELHRYMLAGPFSWPSVIEALNENAICLKAVPTRQQQQQFELERYKFVEPGFVILDSEGNKKTQVDELTTLHPVWLNELIQKSIGVETPTALYSASAQTSWNLLAERNFDGALVQAKLELAKPNLPDALRAELELLIGMATFRTGEHLQASALWKATSKRFPDQPLAWKAAAEAQLIGPFARGFETHVSLPPAAMSAGIESRGSASPKNVYSLQQLHQRSTLFLLSMQASDGGFHDSDYDFGGTDSLGNVHVAVTSLAGLALLERCTRLGDDSPELKKRLIGAVSMAARFVADDLNLNKQDRDEILWACAFRLRFLLACGRSNESEIKTAVPIDQIPRVIESLEMIQSRRGNWYHEYSNPFTTATALLALQEAARDGHSVDAARVKKGAASLAGQRFRNGAFPYMTSKKNKPDNPSRDAKRSKRIGSAGRMPLCELALFQTGKSDAEKLAAAVAASFEYHAVLAKSYKYDNHTDSVMYGGFFFWYDMRSRCEAIKFVADDSQREKFVAQQRALMMGLPELDGCFVDSHELGRVYGTAMALLCFDLLDEAAVAQK